VRRRHGHVGFDVRVGLHTGTVLLGGGVSADGSIRGIAVNIAARMEQSAPTGALRISHDTYRHVRGVFDVEPQPPMQVKGIDEPIVTYLVLRAKPRAFRVVTRGKGYVAYCTSFALSDRSFASRRRSASLAPCDLRGAWSPGGSYNDSFLSL
jgi:hypothetical protein